MRYAGGIFGASDEDINPDEYATYQQAEQQEAEAASQGYVTPGVAQPTGPVTWNQPSTTTVVRPPTVPAVVKPGFSLASLLTGKTPWIIGGIAIALGLLVMASKKKHRAGARA
jgi:uncharacterized membrane protein